MNKDRIVSLILAVCVGATLGSTILLKLENTQLINKAKEKEIVKLWDGDTNSDMMRRIILSNLQMLGEDMALVDGVGVMNTADLDKSTISVRMKPIEGETLPLIRTFKLTVEESKDND